MCDGDTGANNSSVPNLRYSRSIADSDLFRSFVLGGIAEERGMPDFSQDITGEELEAIRAYVIKRANDLKEAPQMP